MPDTDDVLECDIRAALQPHRSDPDEFLAAVQTKVKERELVLPIDTLPRAAAFLPFAGAGWLAQGGGALKATSGFGNKLLAVLSWPAASIFVTLGVAVYSARALRNARRDAPEPVSNPSAEELRGWWRKNRVWTTVFWVGTMLPMLFGSTFFVFCVLNASIVALLFLMRSVAKAGHASSMVIGSYLSVGLFYLGMPLMFVSGPLTREPHLLDPRWLPVVFLLGAALVQGSGGSLRSATGRWARPIYFRLLLIAYAAFLGAAAIANASFRSDAIVTSVESFDHAPFGSANWAEWAILSSWAQANGYEPDLTRPRQLLASEIEAGTNAYILASAMRGGLVREVVESTAVDWAAEDEAWQRHLDGLARGRLLWSEQHHWQLLAALERDLLSSAQQELLIERIHEVIAGDPNLEELAQSIEALDLLGDSDVAALAPRVRQLVRNHWVPDDDGILIYGGFGKYDRSAGCSPSATFEAIQLMLRFGVPGGIDLEQVEWYLYAKSSSQLPFVPLGVDLVAEVTRESFRPIAPPVTVGRFLRQERSLIGALILVFLCFYAARSIPVDPVAARADSRDETGDSTS